MKKKSKFIVLATLLIYFLACATTGVFAQNSQLVTGEVKSTTGERLPGVTVVVKGTTQGTVTDLDGKFQINVSKKDAVLLFSFIGYRTKELTIGTSTNLNVILESDDVALDEVVVTGYGVTKKRDLTSAVSTVSGKTLTEIPVATASQAIAGKLAGVNVVTQSGAPGASTNIVIRGGSSITQSTSPLYIVDGFQMDAGLDDIDPNDILSIDVMKDASATAIYGARGSNGVVIITTKSGKKGKTTVNYNGFVSIDKLGNKMDVLDANGYANYQYELQTLQGEEDNWASYFGGDVSDARGIASYINSAYPKGTGIDWQDEFFGGAALTMNNNVSVSGSNDKTQYVLSFTGVKQNGIIDKTGFNKNGLRLKLNHELQEGVKLTFGSYFQDAYTEGGGGLGGMLKNTILQPATGGILYDDDYLVNHDVRSDFAQIDSQYDISNPMIMNDAITDEKFDRLYNVNAAVDIDILKNLVFRSAGSYTWRQIRNDYWDDGRTTTAENKGGPWGARDNAERTTWQITNTLNYTKDFGEHNLQAMLGQEVFRNKALNLDNTYIGFPNDNFGLNDVSIAEQVESRKSGFSENAIVSFFGRVNYNYADKYLLTATLRADGSSKFAPGNQWGYFPSASFAWRISEESFMDNVGAISNMKLRAGLGTTGNNGIDSYQFATFYSSSPYPINNGSATILTPGSKAANENLKWEATQSLNLGLDASFVDNRINLSADYYNNISKDLLIENDIPPSSGYTTQFQNIGSIRNQGLELVLNTINIKKKDFVWTTDFNISFNRSKVLELFGDKTTKDYLDRNENFSTGKVEFRVREGDPLGQIFGYKRDGVYTTDDFNQNADGTYSLKDGVATLKGATVSNIKPGDVKYQTTAGETSEGRPVWSTNDRTYIGNTMPKFIGGLVNTVQYKNWDFSVFMNFSYGNDVFNANVQRFLGPYLPNQNSLTAMNDRFVLIDPETGIESTNLARLSAMNPDQHNTDKMWSLHADNKIALTDVLDDYVEDGSFLRLNTITLGYSLPKSLLTKMHLSKLRFYCTLRNIHTFTSYSGYDPEVASSSSLLTSGVDNSAYPRSKSYVFGVNLSF